MNTVRVILLNGAPGSGKDLAAKMLGIYLSRKGFDVTLDKFARPLKEACASLLGCKVSDFESHAFKSSKIQGTETTAREFLIACSESLVKPLLSPSWFGRLAFARVLDVEQKPTGGKPRVVIFSDCGFLSEVHHVVQLVGETNAVLISLQGRGSYSGDSRSDILKDFAKFYPTAKVFAVLNNKDKWALQEELENLVRKLKW